MEYKGLFISVTKDHGPNGGGYYCEVFSQDSEAKLFDDFYVHRSELKKVSGIEEIVKRTIDSYGLPSPSSVSCGKRTMGGPELHKYWSNPLEV